MKRAFCGWPAIIGLRFTCNDAVGILPQALEEALDTEDALAIPRRGIRERTHEHQIEARGIRTELGDDLVGVHHVSLAFRHLRAVRTHDEPLMAQLGERF